MQLKRTAQMVGTVQKRQLGRKMQILHKLATCFLCKITDAPHTGARLETCQARASTRPNRLMPPTRGHDLKLSGLQFPEFLFRMPPTRGHDLKHWRRISRKAGHDAPHTGARLETAILRNGHILGGDAPHTGARLETIPEICCIKNKSKDAPHTGARLETSTPLP